MACWQALLIIVLILIAVGILSIFSVTIYLQDDSPFFFVKKQILWVLISLCVMYIVWQIDYKFWREIWLPILFVAVVLLLLVFIPGVRSEINYARRWIRFLGMGIQPSEVAKLAIIIFVASICSRNTDFTSFLKCFLITCVVSLLILFEPDFGGAIFVFLVSMVVLFLSGVRLSYIFCGGIIVPCIALLVALIKMPYVIERIYTFMNPSSNPLAEGYQIRQSLIALGSGGLFGEGPGNSIIKLFYLPQAYSDFIFPIIGEEFGFLGSLVIVGLFSAFLYVGSKITVRCKDRFSFLLAGGITFWIVFQAFINLAVTTALLPAKGIPLPFISFGGSSLFCLLTGVGILLNITRQHACN